MTVFKHRISRRSMDWIIVNSKNAINSVLSVWSNGSCVWFPNRRREIEPHQIFIKFIYICFIFFYLPIFWPFSLDIFSQNMRSYLQISTVLNLNAYFHLFLCCLFLYFDFSFELKKYMQCVYKACENNDYIKQQ